MNRALKCSDFIFCPPFSNIIRFSFLDKEVNERYIGENVAKPFGRIFSDNVFVKKNFAYQFPIHSGDWDTEK